MKLRRILARYSVSLRAMLAVLALTLTLNGVAYLTHHHEAERSNGTSTHTELCGYCSAFASAPADLLTHRPLAPVIPVLLLFVALRVQRRPLTASQPRAPPTR
jgi:hypothetical protein